MTHDRQWLEQELAAQSHWVRRLARSLVHDDFAAEDLVQDAWVAALRRPPDDPRALRAWLGRVVRTLAWKQQRKAAHAPLSDVGGEVFEGTSESELVERLEMHRVLADELHSLREPLRTTLLQRYFEGRSAAQIAEQSSVPAATVRWRLQEGLEELRARLDRRFGGKRETWMSALAFALPAKNLVAVGTGIAIGEGVLMSTWIKFALAAAVLATAAVLMWPHIAGNEGSAQTALAGGAEVALSQPDTARSPDALSQESGQTSPRTSIASAPIEVVAAEPPLPPNTACVVAHISDERRRSLSDAWMEIEKKPAVHVQAAADGSVRAVIEIYDNDSVEVSVGATDRVTFKARVTLERGKTAHLGDVLLTLGATVKGRVVDAQGDAVPDVEVAAVESTHLMRFASDPQPSESAASARSRTEKDGAFELRGVAPGSTRIWARGLANLWWSSNVLDLSAGSTLEGVVVAPAPDQPAGGEVLGVVLDPEDTPLPNIEVKLSGPALEQNSVKTDTRGQFRFVVSTKGPFFIRVNPEASRAAPKYLPLLVNQVAPGPEPRRYKFAAARSMRLEIFGGDAPCKECTVQPRPAGKGPFISQPARTVEGAGEHVRQLLIPSTSFMLKIEAPGFASQSLGPFASESAPENLRVDLLPLAPIRGHVFADGKPVAGAHVGLGEIVPEGREGRTGRFLTLVMPDSRNSVVTDTDGCFQTSVAENKRYHLFAEAAGYARADLGPIELDPTTPVDGLLFNLDQGGTLEGRVLVASGQSPAGTIVGINRADGAPRTQRVGPDGQYRFERLTPGKWELARAHAEASFDRMLASGSRKPVFEPNCTIAAGQTTHQDLDLRNDQPCVLQGTLLIDGTTASGWTIALEGCTDSNILWGERGSVATSSTGQFGLQAEDPGSWIVALTPSSAAKPALQLETTLELHPGPNNWSPALTTGRVEGRVSSAHAQGLVFRSQPEGFTEAKVEFKPGADGSFVLPLVPAGPGEIIEGGGMPSDARVLVRFIAAPGIVTRVDIP